MIKAIIDYFLSNDPGAQSKKEQAAKFVTAAIAVLTVALTVLAQVQTALK